MNCPDFSQHWIVSDLDGTFLGEDSALVPKNIEAIQRFLSFGGHFTVATGRHYLALPKTLDGLEQFVNAPVIACNGTVLYDFATRTLLCEKTFCFTQALKQALHLCVGTYPHLQYWLHDSNGITSPFSWEKPCTVLADSPIRKIVVYNGWEQKGQPILDTVRQVLEENFSDTVSLCRSDATYLEILPQGATKGEMLTHLKKYCKTQDENAILYAVGDYENDLTMLQVADVPACPQNAIDSVKAICRIHLCHHTQGAIADLISRIEEKINQKRSI